MHIAAAAHLRLDLVYVLLPVRREELAEAISGLVAQGFSGANVTVPHKEAVLPLVDNLDPAAAAIGAVNTIVIHRYPDNSDQKAEIRGFNTDWSGFILDLQAQEWDPEGKSCLVMGAGGSARAVLYGLARAGARVDVISRRPEQAEKLVHEIGRGFESAQLRSGDLRKLDEICRQAKPELIVNATPAGMAPDIDGSPWPEGMAFPKMAFVYDLVYTPSETRLMKEARMAGCQVSNGIGMLVHQGAQAFELWTGIMPDIQIMAAALA
jgi:shikimate dehydrogenase